MIRPGVTTADVIKLWPKAEEFGFPNEEAAFALQYGHGVGLLIWEKPVFSRLVSLVHPEEIQASMVFALETFWPAADGWSAARIEEQRVVTKSGCEVITRFPAEQLMVAGTHYYTATGPLQRVREAQSHLNNNGTPAEAVAASARHEEFARTIAPEAGKPIRTARLEVDRAIFALRVAAEEARRICGQIVPLDCLPGTERREGHIYRVPLGPIAGIAPFNSPLNLVVHKVAAALAAGNPIILRPAGQTPVSALKLAEVVEASGWPAGGFSVVPSTTGDAAPLGTDERIRLLTFTGSPAVGRGLKSRAGRKRVTLELGGNAGVSINHAADLDYAAARVAWGGFSYAGQSCISVQRVFVHDAVYDRFTADLTRRVRALAAGDPLDQATDVGPVIDSSASERLENWLDEARADGAVVLAGGQREGNLWQPTVLAQVLPAMRVCCEEAFGPLVGVVRFAGVHEAIAAVNDSAFGLQAGLFTNDLNVVQAAFEEIEVGGLMVNDVSTFQVDHMPYSGVKW